MMFQVLVLEHILHHRVICIALEVGRRRQAFPVLLPRLLRLILLVQRECIFLLSGELDICVPRLQVLKEL